MSATADTRSWRDLAACRTADPELFFPVSEAGPALAEVARAKAVCATCGSQEKCLDYALSTRQAHGVWGGTSAADRRLLRARLAG
jgi:WhiB family redox-sensing transcriptional regulator